MSGLDDLLITFTEFDEDVPKVARLSSVVWLDTEELEDRELRLIFLWSNRGRVVAEAAELPFK